MQLFLHFSSFKSLFQLQCEDNYLSSNTFCIVCLRNLHYKLFTILTGKSIPFPFKMLCFFQVSHFDRMFLCKFIWSFQLYFFVLYLKEGKILILYTKHFVLIKTGTKQKSQLKEKSRLYLNSSTRRRRTKRKIRRRRKDPRIKRKYNLQSMSLVSKKLNCNLNYIFWQSSKNLVQNIDLRLIVTDICIFYILSVKVLLSSDIVTLFDKCSTHELSLWSIKPL